jgi:hypothetical protein
MMPQLATESARATALPGSTLHGHFATLKTVLRVIARVVFLLIAAFLLKVVRDESAVHINLLYLVLALGAIYIAVGAEFRVWAAYVSAFVLFSQLRAWADGVGVPVQFEYAIVAEKALFFGELPTVWLQDHFYTFARLGVLETFTIAIYLSYFFLPHMLALALWKWDRPRFTTYVFALMATLYLGVLVSALLPTAPPWMAGQLGHTPHVYQVLPDIAGDVTPGAYENAYEIAGANPVAAMPSLHAAIPFLMAVALWKYGWARWAGVFYAEPSGSHSGC